MFENIRKLMKARLDERMSLAKVMVMMVAVLLMALSAQAHEIKFEKVFVSNFETLPTKTFPRMEFVSDRMHLFEGAGVSREAQVRVFDALGDLVSDPQIEWSSSDSALLDITPISGASAELLSADAWFGTVEFQASYPPLNLSLNGQAVMADPAPETVLVPSLWVLEILGDRIDRHTIKLERNSVTEALQVGDFVVSGDLAGVMVAVAGASVHADAVLLEGDPAAITDPFDGYSATSTAQPVQVRVELNQESARVTMKSVQTGEVIEDIIIPKAGLLDSVSCSGGLQAGTNVDFSALTVDTTLAPTDPAVQTTGSTVDLVEFGITGTVSAAAALSINVSADVSLQGECKIDLPEFLLPNVTLPPIFSLGPKIEPHMGVDIRLDSQVQAGWVPVSNLQRSWTMLAGVQYSDNAGWNTFSSFSSEGGEPNSGTFSIDADLSLEADANADLGVGLSFCLGHCAFSTELVSVNFLNLSGGPFWYFGISSPLDRSQTDYAGPDLSIGVGAEASAALELSFFESGILQYLPVGGSAGFTFPIFTEVFEFVSTPALSGEINCSPDCDAMPQKGGTLDLQLNAATTGPGMAEFWFGPVGGKDLTLLGTAPFNGGQASGSFGIEGLVVDDYVVFPRLSIDSPFFWFTSNVPVGASEVIGEFTIGDDCDESEVVDDAFLQCFEDAALRQCVDDAHFGETVDEIETLNCANSEVVSLVGIEYMTNLTGLDLDKNQIDDLNALNGLTSLGLLLLDQNQISDVSPLGALTNLIAVSLAENQISDVSPLGKLTNLIVLELDKNQIADVGPLGSLTDLTHLHLWQNQISDVTALAGLANLTSLVLLENQISDVGVLAGLTSLTVLALGQNQITDVSALGGLTNLTTLHLEQNQVNDVSALGGLTNLTGLRLTHNQISDVGGLGVLTNLATLALGHNQINDVGPLGSLSNLSLLFLESNQISDVSALVGLTGLTSLRLKQNQITDVSALGGLTNLNSLNLDENQISDVSALESLSNLSSLNLHFNQINGVNTISCDSLISLLSALPAGVVRGNGCRCECWCGPVNGSADTPCGITCKAECDESARTINYKKAPSERLVCPTARGYS